MDIFEKAINKHFEGTNNKLDFSKLVQLVEQTITENEQSEKKFSAARFYKTALKSFNAPSEQAGKIGTDERKRFQKYITRNVRGKTLTDKINTINAIVEGNPIEGAKISEIMGSLGAVKMLQQTLDDFNESTAGFLFEAFLAGLLQGKQVTERVGGTLPIEDCMFFIDPKTGEIGQPVSLKLLSHKTKIEGSLENLLGFFARPEIAAVAHQKGIEYIVATKTKKNELDMYSFNIKPRNFFYWIEEKHFNLRQYRPGKEDMLQEQKTPEEIEDSKQKWEKAFLLRAPMMGIDPSEIRFNYNWHGTTYWRSIVSKPRTAKAVVRDVAEIILSDAGKSAFLRWTRSEFDVPANIDSYAVSPELEAEFRSENTSVSLAAAKQIAKLGRARMVAYFDSIEGMGERVREAPVHIQRYFAANTKGDQNVEAASVSKIQAILKDGSAESVVKWAQALQRLRRDKQFHINPIRVRSEGTLYGTVNVNKNQIYKTLQKYSSVLEKLCAPIYEELETLSSLINGYYMQNRVGDAFKAADSAKRLGDHTKNLAKEAEEK